MARLQTALLLLVLPAVLTAQEAPLDFFGRGPYRADVPRPDTVLGYGPGARHT